METLRASSYIIPVKLESEEGKYMLIHGYTGAVDIVTKDIAMNLTNTTKVDANLFSSDTLKALQVRGYVTERTEEKEIEYVGRIAKALHREACALYKSFTLIVTYNCNFRCPYCFESRDKKDGSCQFVMTKEMVDKAYKAMELIEPRPQLRRKTIALYGGEPLLKQNKNIIKYIIGVGRSKGYLFMIVTNGYDLNCFLDLFSPDLIEEIQVTIDGTKEYHDQRRVHYKEGSTFDKIVLNVKEVLERGIKVVVRVNNDATNVTDFALLKKYFEETGFFSFPSFRMYSTLLWNSDSISEEEKLQLNFLSSKQYISKHQEMNTLKLCKDNGIFYSIYKSLHKGNPIPFRRVFCPSQAGEYVFDPLGDIYPCWEIVGNKDFKIGRYSEDYIEWDNERLREWRNYDITSSPICKKCKYALYCGGGCVAHARFGKREHCAYFRQMFNISVNRAFESLIK